MPQKRWALVREQHKAVRKVPPSAALLRQGRDRQTARDTARLCGQEAPGETRATLQTRSRMSAAGLCGKTQLLPAALKLPHLGWADLTKAMLLPQPPVSASASKSSSQICALPWTPAAGPRPSSPAWPTVGQMRQLPPARGCDRWTLARSASRLHLPPKAFHSTVRVPLAPSPLNQPVTPSPAMCLCLHHPLSI